MRSTKQPYKAVLKMAGFKQVGFDAHLFYNYQLNETIRYYPDTEFWMGSNVTQNTIEALRCIPKPEHTSYSRDGN